MLHFAPSALLSDGYDHFVNSFLLHEVLECLGPFGQDSFGSVMSVVGLLCVSQPYNLDFVDPFHLEITCAMEDQGNKRIRIAQ